MQSNFIDVFYLILVFGCLRGTLVVTKVLGGLFVSSESVSYKKCLHLKNIEPSRIRSKVRGHEVALLSLENYGGRFVVIPSFRRPFFHNYGNILVLKCK